MLIHINTVLGARLESVVYAQEKLSNILDKKVSTSSIVSYIILGVGEIGLKQNSSLLIHDYMKNMCVNDFANLTIQIIWAHWNTVGA